MGLPYFAPRQSRTRGDARAAQELMRRRLYVPSDSGQYMSAEDFQKLFAGLPRQNKQEPLTLAFQSPSVSLRHPRLTQLRMRCSNHCRPLLILHHSCETGFGLPLDPSFDYELQVVRRPRFWIVRPEILAA